MEPVGDYIEKKYTLNTHTATKMTEIDNSPKSNDRKKG